MSEHDENSGLNDIDKMLDAAGGEERTTAAIPQPKGRRSPRPAPEPVVEAEEPRLHEFLSNADVDAARARARQKVEEQRRKAALKRIEDEEIERLKLEEGLTTGDRVKDEVVTISVDLAQHSDRIVINGQAYHHGFTYDVPRHVADYLREVMARGWNHQDELDGKSRAQTYAQNRQFAMLKKGKAAAATGTMTVDANTGRVGGAVAKNINLRPGPEDHV